MDWRPAGLVSSEISPLHLAGPPICRGHKQPFSLSLPLLSTPVLLCLECPETNSLETKWLMFSLIPNIQSLTRVHAGPRGLMALPQIKTAWGGVRCLVRHSYFCRLLSQCCLDLLQAYSCGLAVRGGRIAAWLTALWPIKVTKPAKCTSRWLAG